MKIIRRIVSLLLCLVVIAAVAIRKDNRLLGHDLQASQTVANDTMSLVGDTLIVHTTSLAADVIGYDGTTPMDVYILNDKVLKVVPLPNNETPGFFERALELITSWDGKTLDEAATMQVDAISGATFSSKAIIENVRRGVKYASAHNVQKEDAPFDCSAQNIAVLAVILLGMIVPLFYHKKQYRIVQLVLDVAVLGLWSGTFLSYSKLVGMMSNGVISWGLLATLLLVVAAFIYPLFGKKEHYCTHLCPFGAAQELVHHVPGPKIMLGKRTVEYLNLFRRIVWAVLMLLMLAGIAFEWMDYEPFTAFILDSACTAVIVFAIVVLLLSVFISRPYCRFLCPTGTLLKGH